MHALTGVRPTKGSTPTPASDDASVPPGGCVGQMRQTMAADGLAPNSADQSLVSGIGSQSFFAARADPRVTAVFATWSSCMRSNGYRYATPFAAATSFVTAKTVTSGEIKTAVTDIGCKRASDLLGVIAAVQSSYQDRLISQHAAQLAQYTVLLRQQGATLARLIASNDLAGQS